MAHFQDVPELDNGAFYKNRHRKLRLLNGVKLLRSPL